MIEVFVKEGLPFVSMETLEAFGEDWIKQPDTSTKDSILPYIIQEKLIRYEKEY